MYDVTLTGASVDTAGPEAEKVRPCVCVCMLFAVFTHNSAIVRECVSRVRGTGKQRALRGAGDVTPS